MVGTDLSWTLGDTFFMAIFIFRLLVGDKQVYIKIPTIVSRNNALKIILTRQDIPRLILLLFEKVVIAFVSNFLVETAPLDEGSYIETLTE